MPADWLNVFLAMAGTLALGGGMLAYHRSLQICRQSNEMVDQALNRIEYEPVAIDHDQADAFRKTPLPTWRDFAEKILGNAGFAAFHDQIRRDTARFAATYAGKLVFVIVKRLPCLV